MSLLGIDVGTTGCKAALFSETGRLLAVVYKEYDVQRPGPGWAELDAARVWTNVKQAIRQVASASTLDPIRALAVSSLGEAMVPVTADRRILGPSIVANFDLRGSEYLSGLAAALDDQRLYRISGNALGNNYSLTKLKWIKERQRDLYRQASKFLLWGSFVPFMLGADPVVDYSLANRTLLFDVDREDWSDELLAWAGLDRAKLPSTVPSGRVVGLVSEGVAAELGLPSNVSIVAGAHDQCATAVGCGVIQEGQAVYGMGTFFCITPVYRRRREAAVMLERGLNTEHHAVPDKYVSFIYNQGGVLVKWYRDTFAALEHQQAQEAGADVYGDLMAEMGEGPSSVLVLPHFAPTGPPHYIVDSRGLIVGLQLQTTRGDIFKGIIEGVAFYLKEIVVSLPPTGIEIDEYRAVGGGSRSDAFVQICADIMGQPFIRPQVAEAGALGAAIIAGVGSGVFHSYEEGVEAMVRMGQTFEPNPQIQRRYEGRFQKYRQLWPLMQGYLRGLAEDEEEMPV